MDTTFFKDLAERAAKTAAQTAVAAIGTTAYLDSIDWRTVGSVATLAAVLSVLTSVASGAKTGSASLVSGTTPRHSTHVVHVDTSELRAEVEAMTAKVAAAGRHGQVEPLATTAIPTETPEAHCPSVKRSHAKKAAAPKPL